MLDDWLEGEHCISFDFCFFSFCQCVFGMAEFEISLIHKQGGKRKTMGTKRIEFSFFLVFVKMGPSKEVYCH